jgi:hypothetical protein
MFVDHMLCTIDGARSTELANIGSDISRAYGNGALCEDDYQRLWEAIKERQQEIRAARQPTPLSAPQAAVRPRRAIPRSPDRAASRQRRRDIGQERWLPPSIASKLTPGEIAVLSVEVREIVKHGVCSLPNDAIAGMAGVCETMVKNTRRLTVLLGFIRVIHRPRRGQKSKTNLIYALSAELKAWIATRRKMIGKIGGKCLPPTQTDLGRKNQSGIKLHHQNRQHRASGPSG